MMHNEGLYKLYSSPNISMAIQSLRIVWAGYVARIEESRNAYTVLIVKPTGKRPLCLSPHIYLVINRRIILK